MACKGICIRYKSYRRYAAGSKRCNQCNLFIKWDGLWCPCCGYRLRNGPRGFKFKVKLRIKQQEQPIQKAQNKNSSTIILHAQ
jgi:hypothetical protein